MLANTQSFSFTNLTIVCHQRQDAPRRDSASSRVSAFTGGDEASARSREFYTESIVANSSSKEEESSQQETRETRVHSTSIAAGADHRLLKQSTVSSSFSA
jgi:hypothetical protein